MKCKSLTDIGHSDKSAAGFLKQNAVLLTLMFISVVSAATELNQPGRCRQLLASVVPWLGTSVGQRIVGTVSGEQGGMS